MTIEKHGNKWRISEQYNGKRYRISLDVKPTKKQAEELLREKIQSGDVSGNLTDTFEQSAEKYIMMKSNVISPTTIKGYRSILRAISDDFRATKTANITPEQIQKEVNDYSPGRNPKTVSNFHGFISAVLGVYRPNMNISTTLPQKRKFEAYTPLQEDIKRILDEVTDSEFFIPYKLGCYGLRRSEICALSAADLDKNTLTINKAYVQNTEHEWIIKPYGKTTESCREIYIDDDLCALIRKTEGRLYKGFPGTLNSHLHRVQKKLDIPQFRFHDLRAFYASMAHSLGISDAVIMANGGWASPNILNRTYKRAMEDKKKESNKLFASSL